MAEASILTPGSPWHGRNLSKMSIGAAALAVPVAAVALLARYLEPPAGIHPSAADPFLPDPLRTALDWYVTRYLPVFALAGAILTFGATANGRKPAATGRNERPVRSPLPAPGAPESEKSARHRVVVVGGGFAGLQAVRGLRRAPVDVTLVDRRNFHLFQPLLYQVATGSLSPGEIATPLRGILKRQSNARVVLGDVAGFDLDGRRVLLHRQATGAAGALGYDTLIVAAGASHAYFGHDDWQSLAPGLKTLEDATEIRRRVLSAFEAAELEPDPDRRHAWLTFAVVGGGPTGVELAGQIAEIARDTLRRDFRSIDPRAATVLLIESGDRLLPAFPDGLSASAACALERLGVTPVLGRPVVAIDPESVTVQGADSAPEHIPTRTVVWAAGVRASSLASSLAVAIGADVDPAGRVTVGPDLTLPGHPEVFALGDMVRVQNVHGEAQVLPGVAPNAMQQGRYAAKLVRARLRGKERGPFHYLDKGNVATIGRLKAVADIRGLHLSGPIAWLAWLVVHLFYLVGLQNRLLVLTRWTGSFLTRGRGSRLITGAPPQESPSISPAQRPIHPSLDRGLHGREAEIRAARSLEPVLPSAPSHLS